MKISRKDKYALIDTKLNLSLSQFYYSQPWLIRTLFKKQILYYYSKGKDDCVRDYQWLIKKIKKIESIK